MTPTPREKYATRLQTLEALQHELESGGRPGDGAVVVGLLLEAAGDVLRRATLLGVDGSTVIPRLAAAPESALRAWADGLAIDELATKLQRAASQAVEAALPDDPESGKAMAQWAAQDLQARDRLESALVALEALGGAGRGDAKALALRLRQAMDRVDARCRGTVTSLTALNETRRLEAGLLDGEFRGRAWWYAERSGIEDDLLVQVLGGERRGSLPEALEAASLLVKQPRRRPASFDDLLRFDLGLATPAEREAIRLEAERDPELKLALAAMEAAESAILEAAGDEVLQSPGAAPVPLPVERSSTPEIIEERTEFKVLLFRTKRTVQVVVQPHRLDRFAAAAVYRSDDPDRSWPARPGDMGVHFDLGDPERLVGTRARVVVKLTDGQTHAIEVPL
jgi:hypothetical protein